MKKLLAIIICLAMCVAMITIPSFAEGEILTVKLTDDGLVINADPDATERGNFGPADWIGIYPESHDGYNDSSMWWYVGEDGGEWVLPDEMDVGENRTFIDQNGEFVPGKWKIIILENDGYFPLEDMDPIYFEIPDHSEGPGDKPAGIINEADYTVSYVVDETNALSWTEGEIGDTSVRYFFKITEDAVDVAIRGIGVNAGDYLQINFNPGNKLADTTGLFLSFVTGDTFKLLQHNHKTALLDDDNPGGADISDKVNGNIVKTENGYEITAKLPKDLFHVTDVENAQTYDYLKDPLYFGMFIVTGGQGYTSQSVAPGENWTCNGLRLSEYSLILNAPTDIYYLYDNTVGVKTGWWMHPVTEGATIDVTFEITQYFKGVNFYAYGCPYDYPMSVVLKTEEEDELFTADIVCANNADYSVDFGKTFAPGTYILSFVGGDVSEISGDTWFVLGSGQVNEAIDEENVYVLGGQTNSDTGPAPWVSFVVAEPDPNAPTAAPTAVPTAAPTAAPTERPTSVPTPVPATDVPASDAPVSTDAPKNDEKTGPNVGLIAGIAAGAVVLIGAVAAIIAVSKKKKKQ